MKKSKLLGWAFMALASITSCSEDTDVLSQESEIKLTSEIAPSRVTALDYQSTQIVAGQQVGVTITGAKTDDHYNVAWSVGENGALTNTGNAVYYGSGDATIIAYHPYNSTWTGTSHSFSVNTDQSIEENYRNSDLLWATAASSKTENAVPLTFTHKLAKINVTLVPEEDTMDLSGATISICNTKISTTFNPTNGTISDASGDPQEIKAGVTTAEAYTASAIVVPQTVNSGSQFIKIALGEKIFYYTLSAGKELKSGYSHNYTLTVKEQKVEVKGDSEIKDWTDEDNVGDAEEFNETLLLPDGQNFNEIVGEYLTANPNLTKIKFVTNSNATSESILVTDDDGTKGYLVANGEWLEIHTNASEFVAKEDCVYMFAGDVSTSPFGALTDIEFGNKFNTSNVTNMGSMFVYCGSLTSLDLSSFDTSNVTNMKWMFARCISLASLDVSKFDTSNLTSMYSMFNGCSNLTSLDLSSFNTSNVKDMSCMFYSCSSLTSLDLSSFNTSNVTDMGYMFNDCRNLTSLDLSSFNTSKVGTMYYMFNDCRNLTSLDLSSFDTSNVTYMYNMFYNCSSLTSLNLSSFFKTSKVLTMSNMFYGCSSLTSLDLSNFTFEETPTVTSMLSGVGADADANDQPIPVKVTADGYTYLTETTTDCGIAAANAKFVQPNGTDWVTE